MKHQTRRRFACGSKESDPPFPFPQGASRGGDGSPHGANNAPPPARGISKHSVEIPLARSPWRASREDAFTCRHVSRHGNIIWSWGGFRWPVLK
jgi:hypothetical protein